MLGSVEPPTFLPRCVSRALNAMRAAQGRALTLSALAQVAGVSTRTLQRQFQTFVGKTPLAALRDIRFQCARRELLRGSPRVTVAEIAHRCGFAHLGRFSVEYYRRYRENPSQTLQRQAAFPPSRRSTPHFLISAADGATVAVVPIGAVAADQAMVRAVAEELATALIRAGVAVTSRPEMARYHLCCMLRCDGQQVRLTCRLIERATGRHIWAYRIDGTAEDLFLFEEGVATKIASHVQPGLRAAEIERARRKPDGDLTAQDLALRALPYALSIDVEGNARALDLLGRAMDRDPGHALAIALAAWCHAQRTVLSLFAASPAQDRSQALSLARRAMNIGGDATVLAILGNALTLADDLEMADLITQKALAIDGSSAWAWTRSGFLDVYKGRPESGRERLLIALDLARNDPQAFLALLGVGCAHFETERYVEAAHWLERAIAEHPSAVWAHQILCPTYMLSGQKEQADRSLVDLQRLYPELTISRVTAGFAYFPQAMRDGFANGLESVGLRP